MWKFDKSGVGGWAALVCVSPADTLTCTTLHKPDMQGGKKDVSGTLVLKDLH